MTESILIPPDEYIYIPPEIVPLPTEIDSDEPQLETDRHREQIDLLIRLLKWYWRDRNDFYATGNLTIYYSQDKIKKRDFIGPDFFVVLGREKKDRRSWVVWHEDGKYPNLIVEILSEGTAAIDKGPKKVFYQDTFRTPEYYLFDPYALQFDGYRLIAGKYEPIESTTHGWLWSEQLHLYLGIHDQKLRFFTANEELVLFPEEEAQQRADQERERADQEQERADQERQLREDLLMRLRAKGIDPNAL
jgi:Uma2 family endonuclease